MAHTINNIDDLISGIPEARLTNPAGSDRKEAITPEITPKVEENIDDSEEKSSDNEDLSTNEAEKLEKDEREPKKTEESSSESNDTDEYGNPVTKQKKMYTEEEVQQKIRDRLKRGTHRQDPAPTPQQQAQVAQETGFQYNEDSTDSWDVQLKSFIKNTIQEERQEIETEKRKSIARDAQVEFESKMETGMSKYDDFVETMSKHLVTNDMLLSVRGLDNPAAFLYAAAKNTPAELDRISKIADPYQQVLEMGRLHEKLKKPKSGSRAPRPLDTDRSDVSDKSAPKYSIDHLIQTDAASRYRR